jgi:hypothetical protein
VLNTPLDLIEAAGVERCSSWTPHLNHRDNRGGLGAAPLSVAELDSAAGSSRECPINHASVRLCGCEGHWNTELAANERESPSPVLLTMTDAALLLAIGRTTSYGLMERGELESLSIGRARRHPGTSRDVV